jgi:hypothetical protein
MLRKNEPQSLGDAIKEFLNSYKHSGKLLESRAISAWPVVMGSNISTYTQEIYIKSKKLYVILSSPVLKNELNMHRSKIVKTINDYVGADVIIDVIFR